MVKSCLIKLTYPYVPHLESLIKADTLRFFFFFFVFLIHRGIKYLHRDVLVFLAIMSGMQAGGLKHVCLHIWLLPLQ